MQFARVESRLDAPATGTLVTRLVVSLAALLFAYLAAHRMVDDDEGYYALAGRAILAGQVPYRDFFLPQMPLGPLAYALVTAVFGPGLMPLRWFAALCALGTTAIVERTARRAGGARAGAFAVVLLVSHTLFWEWAPTVKTFPLALVLGTASLALCAHADITLRRLFLAGLVSGLAVAARALSLPVALAVMASPFLTVADRSRRVRCSLSAAAGVAVALAPVAALAALDPAAFWFDNVGYHAIRGPGEGLVKDLPQKLEVARAVFLAPLGARRPDATGVQSLLLTAGSVFSLRALRQGNAPGALVAKPFALAALLLATASFLPSPSWAQYFAACVPPATVAVAAGWGAPSLQRVGYALLLSAYVTVALPSFVGRVVKQPAFLRPAAFDEVGRALDESVGADVPVAAHDPAYLVASSRSPLPEALNPFARHHATRLGDADRRRFHFFTEAEFRDAILAQRAAFVVGRGVVTETALPLKEAGFRRVSALPGATVWVAPASSTEPP